MTTLHIEAPINDVAAFKAGFADHTETRRQAGVLAERVQHPIGDASVLLIDLDFTSSDEAAAFLRFLEDEIWKDSPVLTGRPDARILEPLALG